MRQLKTNISLAAFQILSKKPTRRRKIVLPCTACWKVTIPALPLFEELLTPLSLQEENETCIWNDIFTVIGCTPKMHQQRFESV